MEWMASESRYTAVQTEMPGKNPIKHRAEFINKFPDIVIIPVIC